MAAKIPSPQDSELNMTPMIDVVFQLIVFFLLSLKFKSVEQRIASELPKEHGITVSNTPAEEKPAIVVKCFRRDIETDRPFTRFRIGNNHEVQGPKGRWTGMFEADEERLAANAEIRTRIREHIASMWAQMGHDPDTRGEVKTPAPFGQGVPHGDVMLVLDAFLEAGIKNVQFEGAMPPVFTPGQGGVIEAN